MVDGKCASVNSSGDLEWQQSPERIKKRNRAFLAGGKIQSEMRATKIRAMSPPSRSANMIHTQTGRLLRISPDGGGTISGSSGSAVTVSWMVSTVSDGREG